MNREETKQRLIELGIEPDRLKNDVWNLRGVDLSVANLSGFILYNADLSGADLSGATLSNADLRRANLSRADLSGADLSGADLSGADLSGAIMNWVNLSRADLSGADLSGADLSGPDLSGAIMWAILTGSYGSFTTGSFGRQTAIAAGGYISINSERHTYEYWLEHYEEILRSSGYNGDEIADYGAWIQLAVARQRRIESETGEQ